MIIEYKPELTARLAEIHNMFVASTHGIRPTAQGDWESLFLRKEIDPRCDVLIYSQSATDPVPDGFAWVYTSPNSQRAYLKGPYIDPDHADLEKILTTLIDMGSERATEMQSSFVETRVIHPVWRSVEQSHGFTRMGAYERMRLFPLTGLFHNFEIPNGIEVRQLNGSKDISSAMSIFESSFSGHWDYQPPQYSEWTDLLSSIEAGNEQALVIEKDFRIVGYILGHDMPDYISPEIRACYLVSIAVNPEFQGSGLGHFLLSAWLRSCYQSGYRAIELDMDENNKNAGRLYRRFGFKKLRTEEVWRKYL